MKVNVSHVNKMQFRATTDSGHEIVMDGSTDIGGENAGARPMETVLAGLGGCSAIDVMMILQKSRQSVDHCELSIDAERGDEVPAVFRKIHLHYSIGGSLLNENKVARAVALSVEKYCSVTKMLEKTADITFSHEIRAD